MYSSDNNKNNSIRNVLFDAAVQLSVPTVTTTASAATKLRANSTTEETILSTRSRSHSRSPSRYSLQSGLTYFSRRSDVIKPKVLRDVATQSSPIPTTDDKIQPRPNHLNLILDNNNNPTMTSSISDTSKEYLAVPRHPSSQRSPSTSPTRYGKSIKNALLGIWQGLNSDEIRSAASSPIDPKYFEERVRIVIKTKKIVSFFSKIFIISIGCSKLESFCKSCYFFTYIYTNKKRTI